MKEVKLATPQLIAGAMRYPVEGWIVVADEDADRLEDNKALDGEPREVGADETDDGLDTLKVDDLKALAAKEDVDLGDATTKPKIIAAIRAKRAEAGE